MSRVRLSERCETDLQAIWNHIGIEKDRPRQAAAQIDTIPITNSICLPRSPILAKDATISGRISEVRPLAAT